MERAREGRRGKAQKEKGRNEDGRIVILGRRKVTPRWADDPVWRKDGCWWRGFWGRRGMPPPPEGHQMELRVSGAVQE